MSLSFLRVSLKTGSDAVFAILWLVFSQTLKICISFRVTAFGIISDNHNIATFLDENFISLLFY